MRITKKIVPLMIVSAAVAAVPIAGSTSQVAHAQECKGVSERVKVAQDFDHTMEWYEVKMNSCDVAGYIDTLDKVNSASSLISPITSRIRGVNEAADYLAIWSWQNKDALKECAKPGTGVSFNEVGHAINSCKPQ